MVVTVAIRTGRIVIDAERCKGCYLCVSACPRGIIRPDSCINRKGYAPAEVIGEKARECTGCAACALMCPDVAISVWRRKAGIPFSPQEDN